MAKKIRAHDTQRLVAFVLLMLLASHARADLSDPGILAQLGPLERRAASANQAVFDVLTTGQSPVCGADILGPTGACSGPVFVVFDNVRQLVHTANALGGSGPTLFTLNLDTRGLGQALRWTAAEELAAHHTAATEFSGGQLGAVLGRLEALRFGATGAQSLQFSQQPDSTWNFSGSVPLGLFGVEADGVSIASRLSAFFGGSYGYGSKRDTTYRGGYEDAFDFSARQGKLGMDYRLSPSVVFGGMLGLAERTIEFDSNASIVEGGIDSRGTSFTAYGQWETGRFYVSASVGGQRLEHRMQRRITYPSLNPLVPSADSTAFGRTHSNALIATLNVARDFGHQGMTLEPYLKGEFQSVTMQGFTEVDSGSFAFRYGSESIQSFDVAAGARIQRVFAPSFAVIVPFLRGEYHRDMKPGSRTNSAVYDGLGALGAAADSTDFSVPTDRQDPDYFQLAGGLSLVMRHGLQGFLQYQQTLGREPFTERTINGGVRLEF